jgi:predicted  nucleic acid-binding Zn-ribbon protein
MEVHGSPLESVRAALASVVADRQKLAQQIRIDLDSLVGDISKASERLRAATNALEAARGTARESYDKDRPSDVGRSADRSSRSELDELLAKRKQQRSADQQFEDAMSSTGGLQRSVNAAQSELGDLQRRQRELQSQLDATTDIDPFEYLSSPAKTWKTDADGVAQVSLPDGAKWVLWAANSREVPGGRRTNTEFYRWIVLVTESIDATETLYLDNSSLWQGGLPPWLSPALPR